MEIEGPAAADGSNQGGSQETDDGPVVGVLEPVPEITDLAHGGTLCREEELRLRGCFHFTMFANYCQSISEDGLIALQALRYDLRIIDKPFLSS